MLDIGGRLIERPVGSDSGSVPIIMFGRHIGWLHVEWNPHDPDDLPTLRPIENKGRRESE